MKHHNGHGSGVQEKIHRHVDPIWYGTQRALKIYLDPPSTGRNWYVTL